LFLANEMADSLIVDLLLLNLDYNADTWVFKW